MKKFVYFLSILLFIPAIFLVGCFEKVENLQNDVKIETLTMSNTYSMSLIETLETDAEKVEPIVSSKMSKVKDAVEKFSLYMGEYLMYDLAIESFEALGFGIDIQKKNDKYIIKQQDVTIEVEKNDGDIHAKKSSGEQLFIAFSQDQKSFNCKAYVNLKEDVIADCLRLENGYALQISIPTEENVYDIFEIIIKYKDAEISSYSFSLKRSAQLPQSIYQASIDKNFAKDYKSEV